MFGLFIGKYMNENRISHKFVSRRTGIPEKALRMILKGERRLMASEYVEICRALRLGLDYFAPHAGEGDH